MLLRMLGALELCGAEDTRPVTLRGTKQRATLGFLLLYANRPVPTSQLLRALWTDDEAPPSARKILQNAVWGLRSSLRPSAGDRVELLTQPPGYLLRVDPEDVDLYRFHRLIDEGRAQVAAGAPERGAVLLREALSLWRGPALADLVETGISWPELTAVQNSRVDAQEEYFEAELASGGHHAVLPEIERAVETEVLRERLYGQLMLALYRCGRQADALNVYARVRAALVEELGLEPGRSLQALQQAILAQDPALTAAIPTRPAVAVASVRPARATAPPVASGAVTASAPGMGPAVGMGPAAGMGTLAPVTGEIGRWPAPGVAERRHVSVLLIHTDFDPDRQGVNAAFVDHHLAGVAAVVRATVQRLGGSDVTSIGSLSLALFVADGVDHSGAARAVESAVLVRQHLRASLAGVGDPGAVPAVRAALVTGDALVRYQGPAAPPLVYGSLLDEGHALLAAAQPGEIRVCSTTYAATRLTVPYQRPDDGSPAWQVRDVPAEAQAAPAADRMFELRLLHGLLEQVRHRSRPHLVTVLGEQGIGKTAVLKEFRQWAARMSGATILTGDPAAPSEDGALTVLTDLVRAVCGVDSDDPDAVAGARFAGLLRHLADDPEEEHWLWTRLGPLVSPGSGYVADVASVRAAWRRFLGLVAQQRPVVLLLDDLHLADEATLDLVVDTVEGTAGVPLLVVVAARPELFKRRPDWCGGKRHMTTMTLDPLPDSESGHTDEPSCTCAPGGVAPTSQVIPLPRRASRSDEHTRLRHTPQRPCRESFANSATAMRSDVVSAARIPVATSHSATG